MPKQERINMRRSFLLLLCGLMAWWGCSGSAQQQKPEPDVNPVEELVGERGEVFDYEEWSREKGNGYTTHLLQMTSQEWLDSSRATPVVWTHWMTVIVPDEVDSEVSLLWIGGGSDSEEPAGGENRMLIEAALQTNTITAEVSRVPFQPISFSADTSDQRSSDALIAYGWRQFLESGAADDSAEWLARVPMTKAVMRAMDTLTEFSDTVAETTSRKFVVGGASKRGWTAWLTAAFDDRVAGVIPVVIDLLNVVPSFEHHWRSLGEWSPAVSDYENEEIMRWLYSAEFRRMMELVDPYSYLGNLADIPKYVINAGNDEFFVPDSWQFYWDDVPGEKYLRTIPNTGHDVSGTDGYETLISFYDAVLSNRQLPLFEWEVDATEGIIRFETESENPPEEINIWSASNSDGRDFRLNVVYQAWDSQPVELRSDGTYEINIPAPSRGYTAHFVEAVYAHGSLRFKQTTGPMILPDTYPHEPFSPGQPLGKPVD